MSAIKLGVKAKDKVTGFEGIVTSKIDYLTGCTQYGITPPVKDGKTGDTEYFDYRRLDVTGNGVTVEQVADTKNPGGPNRDAPRR